MSIQAGIEIDQSKFWRAVSLRVTGCTIVTARDKAGPAGFLGLSATHLSAAPPMMMVSIGASTSALATIRNAGHFALNYLCVDSEDLVDVFSGRSGLKGASRFKEIEWTTLTTGAPILRNAVGALDCVLDETIERHGTVIAIGRLVNFIAPSEQKPLLMYKGRTTTVP